jgi:hypothetical protein
MVKLQLPLYSTLSQCLNKNPLHPRESMIEQFRSRPELGTLRPAISDQTLKFALDSFGVIQISAVSVDQKEVGIACVSGFSKLLEGCLGVTDFITAKIRFLGCLALNGKLDVTVLREAEQINTLRIPFLESNSLQGCRPEKAEKG